MRVMGVIDGFVYFGAGDAYDAQQQRMTEREEALQSQRAEVEIASTAAEGG